MDKLNEKLAKWAGFKEGTKYGWDYPDGRWRRRLPYFDQSLDACFKWLVVKIPYIVEFDYAEGYWACHLTGCQGAEPKYIGEAETPALALCLAIEKLIGETDD